MGVVKKQGVINTLIVYGGTLIGFVSLLLIQPHFLSKEELGLTRLILSYGGVLSILFSLGISAVTIRYLPKFYNKENGHSGFFGFLLLYTFAAIGLGLIILFLTKEFIFSFYRESAQEFIDNFEFVILMTIINSFILGFNAYCIAILKSIFPTFLNDILNRILFICIILLHFWGYLNLHDFLLAFCLTYGVTAILLLIYIFSIEKPGLIPDRKHIAATVGFRPIFRYGLIITVTAINSVSLKYIDQMFVGNISLGNVGIYSVAAFIGLIIEIPLGALERIANSVISHAMSSGKIDEVKTIYFHSARFLLIIGGWLFLMVISNLAGLLSFLPPDYQQGVLITLFIAIGSLVNMATGVNYPILLNSDKYIWGAVFTISLIVFTVIGNLLLIPIFGMLGAAITACLVSVINNFLRYGFIWKRFQLQPFDSNTLLIALLTVVLTTAGYFLQLPFSPILSIVVKGLLFSVLFFGILLWRGWASDLYHYLPQAIRKRLPFMN